MGALDECHYNVELENGINVGECVELGFEGEPETLAIEDAVGVLLQVWVKISIVKVCGRPLSVWPRPSEKGFFIALIAFNFVYVVLDFFIMTTVKSFKFSGLTAEDGCYKQKVNDIVSGALFPEAGWKVNLVTPVEQVKCHVGYVPSGQRVVGLSKLSRVAEVFAKRLQDPQRLADEVCSALQQGIKPTGVAVVLQCSHINFPDFESAIFDPNHQGWVKVSVMSGSGVFGNEKADCWTDFLSLLRFRDINVENACGRGSVNKSWCPSQTNRKIGASDPAMVSAVSSILSSLGEDPSRKELAETPARFVKWLLNFKNTNLDMKLNGFVRSKRDSLTPNGDVSCEDVMVVVEANHTCMISRGIEKFGSSTATVAVLGRFSTDPTARAKFLQIIPNSS
ncbi:UNVERIFIED_CONTAM: GTP cyclohydrolase 1 [Sesamum angustifolium]|uniref:GTP cyclohydrolase 1 n=1 Tax=Sesamum angustifolium TaxID=2727405 RepID=A0AAW2QP50_9LAMI